MTTGNKIRELRKQNNMTQENLADYLEVSRQAISKYECDETYPETKHLIKLSNLFKVSVDYLLKDYDISLDTSGNDTFNKEEALKYIKDFNHCCKYASFGIFLTIFSISGLLFSLLVNSRTPILPIIFIIMLVFGLGISIFYKLELKEIYSKDYIDKIKAIDIYKKETTIRKYLITISIVFIILDVFLLFPLIYDYVSLGLASTVGLGFLSIFVSLYYYSELMISKYKSNIKKSNNVFIFSLMNVLATICFFVWGYLFDAYDKSWICFVVFYLIGVCIKLILDRKNNH